MLKDAALLTDAANRSTLQRVLNSNYDATDEERRNAAASTREIEDLMKSAGIKLSPQQLTGLGYLYLITSELDKSKAALLDALRSDASAGEPNALLAIVAQLQAHEQIQKKDLAGAREMLGIAENAAKQAQWAFPEDHNIGNQLGYIYSPSDDCPRQRSLAKLVASPSNWYLLALGPKFPLGRDRSLGKWRSNNLPALRHVLASQTRWSRTG